MGRARANLTRSVIWRQLFASALFLVIKQQTGVDRKQKYKGPLTLKPCLLIGSATDHNDDDSSGWYLCFDPVLLYVCAVSKFNASPHHQLLLYLTESVHNEEEGSALPLTSWCQVAITSYCGKRWFFVVQNRSQNQSVWCFGICLDFPMFVVIMPPNMTPSETTAFIPTPASIVRRQNHFIIKRFW